MGPADRDTLAALPGGLAPLAAAGRPLALAPGEICVLSHIKHGEVADTYTVTQAGKRGAATAAALVGGPGVSPRLRADVAVPLKRAIDAAFPRGAPSAAAALAVLPVDPPCHLDFEVYAVPEDDARVGLRGGAGVRRRPGAAACAPDTVAAFYRSNVLAEAEYGRLKRAAPCGFRALQAAPVRARGVRGRLHGRRFLARRLGQWLRKPRGACQ